MRTIMTDRKGLSKSRGPLLGASKVKVICDWSLFGGLISSTRIPELQLQLTLEKKILKHSRAKQINNTSNKYVYFTRRDSSTVNKNKAGLPLKNLS